VFRKLKQPGGPARILKCAAYYGKLLVSMQAYRDTLEAGPKETGSPASTPCGSRATELAAHADGLT